MVFMKLYKSVYFSIPRPTDRRPTDRPTDRRPTDRPTDDRPTDDRPTDRPTTDRPTDDRLSSKMFSLLNMLCVALFCGIIATLILKK